MKKYLHSIDGKICILLLLTTILVYWQVFLIFYQQDEWQVIGHFQTEGLFSQISSEPWYLLLAGSMRVLSHPLHIIFFHILSMQIWPIALFSIIFHFLNSFLVYVFVKSISSNRVVAAVSGIFFAVSSTASQAIIWPGAMTTTLPANFFLLLSLFLFLKYLRKFKPKFLYWSFIFSIIAFLFKESSIIVLLLYPVIYLLYAKNKKRIKLKLFLPFVLYFIAVFLIRIYDLLTSTTNPVGKFATDSSIIDRVMFFSWTYPLTALSQYFVPLREMFTFAMRFERVNYPFIVSSNYAGLVSERIVGELLSVVLSFFIILFFAISWSKTRQFHKTILFAFSLLVISILPFVIIERGNAYLESRYYYVGTTGAGILLGVFTYYLLVWSKKIKFIPKKLYFVPATLVLTIIFYFQISSVYKDFELQVMLAAERKAFISDLKRNFPVISSKQVFLVTGNQPYYGYNHYVPFQQGLGYTLMVIYYKDGKIPSQFLKDNFLWNVGEEGYRESDDKGFGYFADKDKLTNLVRDDIINPEQVIAVEYDSSTKSVKNVTNQFLKGLR